MSHSKRDTDSLAKCRPVHQTLTAQAKEHSVCRGEHRTSVPWACWTQLGHAGGNGGRLVPAAPGPQVTPCVRAGSEGPLSRGYASACSLQLHTETHGGAHLKVHTNGLKHKYVFMQKAVNARKHGSGNWKGAEASVATI